VKTSLFDYQLPPELIAGRPPDARDGGRLFVLGRESNRHSAVREWCELVHAGSLVVLNETRVRRARLLGERVPSGGKVELLFLEQLGTERGEVWQALGRASKPLRPGTDILAEGLLIRVQDRDAEGVLTLDVQAPNASVEAVLERCGRTPIPPYLAREDDAEDAVRYQTVFARARGSVAAPTASLHLTEAAITRLTERGVALAKLVLHIGLDTFRPVSADDLDRHTMHSERFEVGPELAAAVEGARQRGAPIVAVGTTVVRALEAAADPERPGYLRPMRNKTRLFIQPGYRFQVVDALLTNFHQPKSTLLALVAAFAGRDRLLQAYREAIAMRYRFLSYGDAMWIAERLA
jgi:S-adenosylmethionine:tRNA ribosyltransferase-isomerase